MTGSALRRIPERAFASLGRLSSVGSAPGPHSCVSGKWLPGERRRRQTEPRLPTISGHCRAPSMLSRKLTPSHYSAGCADATEGVLRNSLGQSSRPPHGRAQPGCRASTDIWGGRHPARSAGCRVGHPRFHRNDSSRIGEFGLKGGICSATEGARARSASRGPLGNGILMGILIRRRNARVETALHAWGPHRSSAESAKSSDEM